MPVSDSEQCRLPASLHAVYLRYKAGTTVIVDWLLAQNKCNKGMRIPVRELLNLAESVAAKAVRPPKQIKDAFSTVLLNRNKVTRHFNRLQNASADIKAGNATHQHFNDMLAKAYDALFPEMLEPVPESKVKANSGEKEASTPSFNRFDVLSSIIEKEPDVADYSFLSQPDRDDKDISQSSALQDDPLEKVLDMHIYVLEFESVIDTVKLLWKDVARGNLPFAVAGWTTNLAWEMVRFLVAETIPKSENAHLLLKNLIDNYCHAKQDSMRSELQKWEAMSAHAKRLEAGEGLTSDQFDRDCVPQGPHLPFREFSGGEGPGLTWPLVAIKKFMVHDQFDESYMAIPDRNKLERYIGTLEERQEAHRQLRADLDNIFDSSVSSKDTRCEAIAAARLKAYEKDRIQIASILRSFWNIVKLDEDSQFRAKNMAPLIFTITEPYKEDYDYTWLTVGLHMLLESTRSFLWTPKPSVACPQNPASCRIQLLKVAKEVDTTLQSLKRICSDELFCGYARADTGKHRNIAATSSEVLKTSLFDLYHQTPWVVGSQLCSLMGDAQAEGIALLNDQGLWGSMLHIHNMLTQVGVEVPEMAPLEELLKIFAKSVFIDGGSPPKTNFHEVLKNFQGGSLHFGEGIPNHILPPIFCHVSRYDGRYQLSSKRRIHIDDICLFGHHCVECHIKSGKMWSLMAPKGYEHLHGRKHGEDTKARLFREFTTSEIILKGRDLLQAEFTGPLPVARINYLKVYELCLQFWQSLIKRYSAPGGYPKEFDRYNRKITVTDLSVTVLPDITDLPSTMGCVYYTMADTTVMLRQKKKREKAKKHSSLLTMRDALVEVWGNLVFEDLLWQEI